MTTYNVRSLCLYYLSLEEGMRARGRENMAAHARKQYDRYNRLLKSLEAKEAETVAHAR